MRQTRARMVRPGDTIRNGKWTDAVDEVTERIGPDGNPQVMMRLNDDTATRFFHPLDWVEISRG